MGQVLPFRTRRESDRTCLKCGIVMPALLNDVVLPLTHAANAKLITLRSITINVECICGEEALIRTSFKAVVP